MNATDVDAALARGVAGAKHFLWAVERLRRHGDDDRFLRGAAITAKEVVHVLERARQRARDSGVISGVGKGIISSTPENVIRI